jgi:eukaryotic-like serine/threonine-protein kinase
MSSCPSPEEVRGLLADELNPARRNAVVGHVEGCLLCQQTLARLTGIAETEKWQRAMHPPQGSEAEDEMVRRLKRMPRASGWDRCEPTAQHVGPLSRAPEPAIGAVDAEWPAVAGYEIVRQLGRGGMGVVYEARQVALRRTVALKMIRTGTLAGPRDIARFRAEAEVIARLQHPNIVQIYDAGEAGGQPYLALEFVAGGSLAQQLDGTPQPVRPAALLIETVARAVHAAHALGVVHRDLKPANILLGAGDPQSASSRDGGAFQPAPGGDGFWLTAVPKITDFGLAKCVDGQWEVAGQGDPTVSGEIMGTPNYMAPEQAATPRRPVGPAADIHALGAILYELLTGRAPYRAESPLLTVLQVIYGDPVSVTRLQPDVPRDLETICLKCLEKGPRQRYGSALELADDLRRFQSGHAIRARPPSALDRLGKFAQRNKGLVAALAALVAALAAGAIAAGLFALSAIEQKHLADRERDTALRQAYYARLAAAGAALRDDDVPAAALHLEEAPAALRNWEWNHFHSRLDASSEVFRAPGRDRMLLGCGGSAIRLLAIGRNEMCLLDPDGGERLKLDRNGLAQVNHIWHTSRGTLVLAEDESRYLVVLDETGKVRLRLAPPPGGRPDTVAVSPDQTRLLVGWSHDNPLHHFALYDLATGDKRSVFAGHTEYIHGLVFSPDGRQVASASEDHTARLWDAATDGSQQVLRGHADNVNSVAYSPDGARVVTASADGTVRQWDAATGKPVAVPYRGHGNVVDTAVYSPDGRTIASGGHDGTIRLWRAADQEDEAVLHGHTATVYQLTFSPDGRRLASAASDGTARLWEVGTETNSGVLRGHKTYVYPVAYSPDGQWIASGSWDQTVRLWDARTGEPCATLHHAATVRALAFSPDGSWLVSAGNFGDHLQVWNVATGQRQKPIRAPSNVVLAVTVSPDGAWVAAVGRDGRVGIMDVATGRESASLRMAGDWTEKKALAYSPDGRRLGGTGEDSKNIDIWDTQTHTRAARLVGHTAAVTAVAFSADGRRLVSTSSDRTVRIWDLATAALLKVLRGHSDEVFTAVFHPDGARVASSGRDRAIRLWDVATGAEVARLDGHTNYVFSMAFSPDGTTLASGSGDGTVRLWDTKPWAERFEARRRVESLRPEADRLVGRLFRELKEPPDVVRSVREDPALSPLLQKAVQRAIWHRLAPPD